MRKGVGRGNIGRNRGSVTVFVSLMLAVLLFFFQAGLQSARSAFLRSQAEEALELAEYSVLSEYHRELWERYGMFYLDLGYGGQGENTGYLRQRIRQFLNENLPGGTAGRVEAGNIGRATDGRGMAWYEQAVSCMKGQLGILHLEEAPDYDRLGKQAAELQEAYEGASIREQENLEELGRRRAEEEGESTPNPVSDLEALKRGSILNLVLKDPGAVSGKKADLGGVPSVRSCIPGAGPRGKYGGTAGNDVFFHAYLLSVCSNGAQLLAGDIMPGSWLDYQAEYLIAGKDTDIGNLEAVCGRLLALREGLNYGYLLSDGGKQAECQALAALLVGATLIPGLVEAVAQVLLLGWAFAESVLDVRLLLGGKRVAFWKGADTWKLSLTDALELGNSLEAYDEREDSLGIRYRDYLGMLLALITRETKAMRGLDVVEGVVRGKPGGMYFRIDQCTDGFWVEADLIHGRELTARRWFCYEW